MSLLQRRRGGMSGESADEALDRMIAQTQEEGERRRALSAPRRMEGGVRRLEIQAGAEGDGRAQGREGEVARPAGLPQALGPEAPPVAAQQELPGGGRSTMVVGPLLRGVAQDVAGAVGNQLQALGTLFPGAQVRSCVPQGGPPGVLPLQGLHAELHQRSGQGINDQGGGCPSGGHVGGAMLGPLAEPLPPLVAFQLPQQQQMGSAASPHPPAFHPSGSQPAQGLGVMVTPVREPRDLQSVPMVSPVPMQMVSPVPMQALAGGGNPAPVGTDPSGGTQMMMDPAAMAVEEIRKRVMREAEEAFAKEVRRLQGQTEETQSYQSASSGAGQGQAVVGQALGTSQPLGGVGGMPSPPPGIDPGFQGRNQAGLAQPGPSLTEALRALELPKLPTPGSEGASIQFGDWMTVVHPLMSALSGSAGEWWSLTVKTVEHHYQQWLVATPLEKLRMKPGSPVIGEGYARLEQRSVSMLLAALPEGLRQDVIASRRLSTVGILFRLFTTFQPGGSGERTGLIKSISEAKVPAGLVELLGSVRQWRRSVGRSEELSVTVDPLVLTGVLSKFADGASRLGGSQVAFRLATMRQQLDVDRAPSLGSVKEWAEYIQAELEELANAQTAGKATPSNPPALAPVLTQGNPAVKAFTGEGQKPWERPEGEKAPCRFWGTDEGCRRGEKCGFAHAWGTLEKSSRCLLCSSTGHRKRDCPTAKPKDGNGWTQKGDRKVAKVLNKKGEKSTEKESQKESTVVKEAAEENPQPEKRSEGSQPKQEGDLVQNLNGLVKSMTSIKSVFIKTVKMDKECGGEYALLDGGATHALRQAKSSEVPHLWPVQVEMAMGSVTLYRCAAHNTLLALDNVEPIIPLRLLVDHGFKIDWQKDRCDISHPKHGNLQCVRRQGCPVMDRSEALSLLESLENGGVGDYCEPPAQEIEWWKEKYPQVPERIWSLMRGQGLNWEEIASPLPWNRAKRRRLERARGGVVIHLFSGSGGESRRWRDLTGSDTEVLTVDISSNAQEDLHAAGVWAYLWGLAERGRIRMITAGPPCRTVSRLRHKIPGPRPLRGRKNHRFALDELTEREMTKVDGDTALWLKTLGLYEKSQEGMVANGILGQCGLLVESPQDPCEYVEDGKEYPSFWEWEETEDFLKRNPDMFKVRVDQGALGHPRPKPTTLLTNIVQLKELDGITSKESGESVCMDLRERLKQTASWSAWAPGLMAALKIVIPKFLASQAQQPMLSKLDLAGWKKHLQAQHVPYRRDCKVCLETMGSAEPHRRKRGQESAFVMSVDICGPFKKGTDLGVSKRRKVKYALLATIPVPQWPSPGEKEDSTEAVEPQKEEVVPEAEEVEASGELLLAPEPRDLIPEEEARKRNQAWEEFVKKEVKEISKDVPVVNITFMEPLASRHQNEITKALSKVHARAKSLGIPIYRVHSDRERSFTTNHVAKWCEMRQVHQTFNAGDEPEANGRIEGEINQFKRRLRLLLAETGVSHDYWPCAARHGVEERLRAQMRKLGAKCKEMPPFAVLAQVKAKLWHRRKEGALSSPYKTLRIMGPSPQMTNGWVALDEEANLVQHARSVFIPDPLGETARLELETVDDPKDPPKRRLNGKQPLVVEVSKIPLPPPREDRELESLLAVADAEEEDGYEPSILSDSELVPPEAELGLPALMALRAGGESLVDGTQLEGWGEIEKTEVEEYVNELRYQHWNLRKLLQEQVNAVAGTEEEGAAQGQVVQHVSTQVRWLESELEHYSRIEEEGAKVEALEAEECERHARIAALSTDGQPGDENQGVSRPPTVLQTYTIPLTMVKRDMESWIEPIKAEYNPLVYESQAVKPVKLSELEAMEGYQDMELAPSKLVATVKSPNGKRKARIVICGNLVTKAHEDGNKTQATPVTAADLYAGGADATAIRCMVRKTAMMDGWDMGVLDIKGAFLLAPRRREQECLMMTIPPKLLVQAGICPPEERWVIQKAMYGLKTSPADWSSFRDQRVKKFEWSSNGRSFWMRQTVEPNVWQLVSSEEPGRADSDERVEGFCTFYVDDVLVCGPTEVIKGCLNRINQEWNCSEAEYLSEKGMLRFCGMELKLHPRGGILLSQESYTKDVLDRYPDVPEALVPIARTEDVEESPPEPADVKRAQTLVGELLWVSTKTRPDVAYAVSWMGSRASKCPKRVCQLGRQTLGYLKATVGHGLLYQKCQEADRGPNGNLAFCRDANTLEVHSDASFGPGGERLRSRALHEAVQQEVWKVKHMAGVELAADFLTKPITVGATWPRFRRFAGLYDMAEPEDLETLKKIGICREWALKGLTVAVELERNYCPSGCPSVRALRAEAMATSVADAGGEGGDGPGDGGDDRKPWPKSSMDDDIYTGEKKKRKRKKKNKAAKADQGEEKGPSAEACDEEEKEDEWPSWENRKLEESEETVAGEPGPVTLMQATPKTATSAAPLPAPLPPQDNEPTGEEVPTATGSQPASSQGPENPDGTTYTVRGHGRRDIESGFFWGGEKIVVSFVNADGDLEIRRGDGLIEIRPLDEPEGKGKGKNGPEVISSGEENEEANSDPTGPKGKGKPVPEPLLPPRRGSVGSSTASGDGLGSSTDRPVPSGDRRQSLGKGKGQGTTPGAAEDDDDDAWGNWTSQGLHGAGEPEGEPPAEDHPPDEEENEDYDIHARKDLDDGSGTKRPPPDSGSYSMKAMCGDLLPLRVTVGFEEDTNRRFVKTDRWDVEPANPATSRWTGWTFFRLKNETGTVHDRTVSRSSSDDARGEGHRFHLPERDGAGEPHDRGELQPAVLRLPDGAEGHLGLLPDLPGGEENRVDVSRAATAKSYAPLPTQRAPAVRPKAQTSAGRRAQPVLADLQRRDGLPPAEEELSDGGSWSEVSGETW
ncbi:unnamed protein product [Cladocopium goreaui]|uniref:Copia protein (Gag-int-pol protein) [Cleaved into: Copia VLP protein Copia protease ] n=1 Tax=Cladocopium goreaui TaxID=2562237 RepID=A0A9P1DQY4_9DINO|nr:unnamed protein product [Cladocopium goreaui]